jgi:hypothetical protein
LVLQRRDAPHRVGRLRGAIEAVTCSDSNVAPAARSVPRTMDCPGWRSVGVERETIETDLLAMLVGAEAVATADPVSTPETTAPEMTDAERADGLALLRRPDLLEQVARDIDGLGYVGEATNTRLLYLVAVSRKLAEPLSAIVLSQSGAGKSGLAEVIEHLTPPEDVVLLTRLTPRACTTSSRAFWIRSS